MNSIDKYLKKIQKDNINEGFFIPVILGIGAAVLAGSAISMKIDKRRAENRIRQIAQEVEKVIEREMESTINKLIPIGKEGYNSLKNPKFEDIIKNLRIDIKKLLDKRNYETAVRNYLKDSLFEIAKKKKLEDILAYKKEKTVGVSYQFVGGMELPEKSITGTIFWEDPFNLHIVSDMLNSLYDKFAWEDPEDPEILPEFKELNERVNEVLKILNKMNIKSDPIILDLRNSIIDVIVKAIENGMK